VKVCGGYYFPYRAPASCRTVSKADIGKSEATIFSIRDNIARSIGSAGKTFGSLLARAMVCSTNFRCPSSVEARCFAHFSSICRRFWVSVSRDCAEATGAPPFALQAGARWSSQLSAPRLLTDDDLTYAHFHGSRCRFHHPATAASLPPTIQ